VAGTGVDTFCMKDVGLSGIVPVAMDPENPLLKWLRTRCQLPQVSGCIGWAEPPTRSGYVL
jgi:hypothetical protein